MYNNLKSIENSLNIFFNSLIYDLIKSKATKINIVMLNKDKIEILCFHNSSKLALKKKKEKLSIINKEIYENNGFTYFNYLSNTYVKQRKFIDKFDIKIICVNNKSYNKVVHCLDTDILHKSKSVNRKIMVSILSGALRSTLKYFVPFHNTEIQIILDKKKKYLLNRLCNNKLINKRIFRIQTGINIKLFCNIVIKKNYNKYSKVSIFSFKMKKPINNIHIYINNYYISNKSIIKNIKDILENYKYILKYYLVCIFISFNNKKIFNLYKDINSNKNSIISKIIYSTLNS